MGWNTNKHRKIKVGERLSRLEISDWLLIGLIVGNVLIIYAFIHVDKVMIFLLNTLGVNRWYTGS